jgi:alginate O-acetyltransferase complex protein AlgJ
LYETVASEQGLGADALFGDIEQRLMLVGTSYSRIDDWNFAGFLKEALQSDLLMVALEARGPFQAMDEFLASEAFDSPELATVIWEFPVRTLLAHSTTTRTSSVPSPTQP